MESASFESAGKLAAGNVYHHEFLSDDEKINLLRTEFRPLGPQGVADEDYTLRKLYILKEVEDVLSEDAAFPQVYTVPLISGRPLQFLREGQTWFWLFRPWARMWETVLSRCSGSAEAFMSVNSFHSLRKRGG